MIINRASIKCLIKYIACEKKKKILINFCLFRKFIYLYIRANSQLCDGTIRCARDELFPIHRAIISAISPYFRALFTTSLRGSSDNTREISISDVPGDIFTLILDYAYTGACRVTAENVEQLLPLADQFEVLAVVQLCCQFLLQELRPDNCLGIYKFAQHYFCHDLEEKGRKYIRHNFKKILMENAEFKELECDEVVAILKDDELNVRNEEVVFEAIKTWIETKEDERKKFLPKLLACVRFGLINSKFIVNNILTWRNIQENQV